MKPLTRKEMLLDGAAKGNLDDFKPATREEVFAKRALANAGGSGGGLTDYYFGGGYVYHDATMTQKVTKAEVVEAMKDTTIRLTPTGHSEWLYTVIHIDTYEEWAYLYYLGTNSDTDCRCAYFRVATAEWDNPVG